MRWLLRFAPFILLIVVSTACNEQGGGGGKVSPVTPTGPSATASDLAGNWSGTFQGNVSGNNVWAFTWNATTQQGGATGPSTLTWVSVNNPPSPNQLAHGTITATVSGTSVSLAFNYPTGSLEDISGGPTCSMTGGGTVAADASTISGTITINFSSTCSGRPALGGVNQTGGMVLRKG